MAGALLAALRAKGVTAGRSARFCRRHALAGAQTGTAGGSRRHRHRRHRRRRLGQSQFIDGRGVAGGRLRAARRQAWQSLHFQPQRQRGFDRGSWDSLCRWTRRQAAQCFAATGFTFLFAPYFHPAMKALAPIRAALGIRTVFNLLGPLTNPAAPRFRLIGAYDAADRGADGRHLGGDGHRARLGGARRRGLGRSHAHRPLPGVRRHPCRAIRRHDIDPREFGLAPCHSARLGRRRCRGESRGIARCIRGPRSRSAFCGAGRCNAASPCTLPAARRPLQAGIDLARAAVDSGRARGVAAAACGNSRRQTGRSPRAVRTVERLSGRHGSLERGARGAGASA